MRSFITFIIVIFFNQMIFGQLEFTNEKRLLFVGSDSIEGKKIISGVSISPVDSSNLNLKIDILDDWKPKDSFHVAVKIDTSSINGNLYFINDRDVKKPAYRYFNDNGLEIFIAKENWHDDSYNSKGEKIEKFYTMSVVEIILPKNKKFYVKKLPIMFQK